MLCLGGAIDWSEVRAWVQLGLATIGGTIALLAFFQNIRQRRVDNALKLVTLFKGSLEDSDIECWRQLFYKASEPAGAKPGHFVDIVDNNHQQRSIGEYFSEGAPDNYAVSRLTESLEVVCHQVISKAADGRTVYYELAQLIHTLADWLQSVPSPTQGKSLLEYSFTNIHAFDKKYRQRRFEWPSRVWAYVE